MIDLRTVQHWLDQASDSDRREVLRTLTEKMLNGTSAKRKVAVFDEAGHRVAVLQREDVNFDSISDEERREITRQLENYDPDAMLNEDQFFDLVKKNVPELAHFTSLDEIAKARREGRLP